MSVLGLSAETLVAAFSAIGAMFGVTLVVMMARSIASHKSIEARIADMVRHRLESEHKLRRLRGARAAAKRALNSDLDDQELKLYRIYLEQALEAVREEERRVVEEALNQPSEVGRRRYLQRLIEEIETLSVVNGPGPDRSRRRQRHRQ